ncbi:bile acid:sodium symporter family protein [Paraoerskovia marina]|uniref:Bile acid:Na+ symporter, BASS family n=1 Tax=Paraoerskovia marina TaxID=545619 RepID=A0A1H1NAA7_9CELL|nr:bile acid:sodium symporter [Paraoerskovia marina]SDR95848.1 bile acid:Na+ symporter, BASS family [Paraoerskovia marina]
MSDFLIDLARVAILTFVITSMVALGLSLTVSQITAPLRSARVVVFALLANFVVAPLAAWGIGEVFGLDDTVQLALILLGVSAGAPFLPKLAQMARGDVAYSVGLMVLLMVASVVVVPLVLATPLVGVEVSAWDIARPLVLLMLLPLVVALAVRARYPHAADAAAPLNRISSTALALGLVAAVVAGFSQFVDQFGTGILLATLALLVVCLLAGWVLGGSGREQRVVSSLGAGQRNLSAALLVAGTSFTDTPEVLVAVLLGALLLTIVLLALAAELGRRVDRADV